MCKYFYKKGEIAICMINNHEHSSCFQKMKGVYERLFLQGNFVPNNECMFFYINEMEKCPCYEE